MYYIDTHPFVSNIWSQPVGGGPPKQITHFTCEQIDGFDWSRDSQLACARSHGVREALLITDFR
ncbi:MAG: hypothetical protein ABIV48_02195 [Pyrinomonadaceae bacterium]